MCAWSGYNLRLLVLYRRWLHVLQFSHVYFELLDMYIYLGEKGLQNQLSRIAFSLLIEVRCWLIYVSLYNPWTSRSVCCAEWKCFWRENAVSYASISAHISGMFVRG